MHMKGPAHPKVLNTGTGRGPLATAAMTSAMWPCVQPVTVTRASSFVSMIFSYLALADILAVKSTNRPEFWKSCTMCAAEGWERSAGPSANKKKSNRCASGADEVK